MRFRLGQTRFGKSPRLYPEAVPVTQGHPGSGKADRKRLVPIGVFHLDFTNF